MAGTSRAKPPEAMEQELRPVFETLAALPCSTFDSSAEVGSIGRAIAVSRDYFFGHDLIPVLVGASPLGRYTLFGQHFARMGNTVYRLDRHPTMARHPITPMTEADLGLHLARQPHEKIALMDILELEGAFDQVRQRFAEKLSEKPSLLLFDVLNADRLQKSARQMVDVDTPPVGLLEQVRRYLGALAKQILRHTSIQRVVVAGGDTSGFVPRALGVCALEIILPVSPGAPLYKAYQKDSSLSALGLALKGGQIGGEDYFEIDFTCNTRVLIWTGNRRSNSGAFVPSMNHSQ
ncbi:putative protein DUF1537 [Desulfosarcina variabilis str. Montpellier]